MKFNGKILHIFLSKALSIALVIMLVGASAVRYPILAQESPAGGPDPTPAADQTVVVDATPTVDTTSTTIANTGDNTIGETPSPDPNLGGPTGESGATGVDGPTGTTGAIDVLTDTVATDSAVIPTIPDIIDAATAAGTNGDTTVNPPDNSGGSVPDLASTNSQGGPASSPTPTPGILTDAAIAVTAIDNSVNTTAVNSNLVNQTINLYIDQNGVLDLSDPVGFIRGVLADHPTDPTINLHITSVTNAATVTNTINSTANTGNNLASTPGSGAITTGDAISLVSILNRVNLIMIDSVLHIVTINIFGTLNGDIILPMPMAGTGNTCSACATTSDLTNTADVTNNVSSNANSGGNTVTGNGSIQTGGAGSTVDIINLVNTTIIGGSAFALYVTTFGAWDGSFVGYGEIPSGTLGSLVVTNGQAGSAQGCCTTDLVATNSATVTNNVASSANTGGNTINGNGTIATGNAVSEVSIINLINTVLYRTTAFFGFINIFGTWHGNVGDAASLAKVEASPTPDPAPETAAQTGGGPVNEAGGLLTMTQTNNVGAYVNPGDTVTFFATLHNPGNGRVFDTNLILHLFKDGVDVGGTTIHVGTIKIGGTVKVSVGLVLSPNAPGGLYIAHAEATGHVGPGSDTVTASADSSFSISGAILGGSSDTGTNTLMVSGTVPPTVQVLGTTTRSINTANILLALLVLVLMVPQYVFYRATRNRNLFTFAFTSDLNWKARMRAVQTFLL